MLMLMFVPFQLNNMCVSGLCDGGAVDAGVSGGEFSRVSEKQRPNGSSNQVSLCS